MVRNTRHTAANRNPLAPQSIIEEALALADAEGLAAVTIRKLATRLGVTPMALYWHVRNKDELLDGVAARIFEDIDPSVDASAAWQDQLRTLLHSMVGVLRAHPAAAILLSTRTVTSEAGLRVTETALDILRRGGFSPAEATQIARHALDTVANLAGGERGVVARDEPDTVTATRQQARLFLGSLPAERYPRLVEAAAPLSEGVDPDAYLAFGLDLLLAGIEGMAARAVVSEDGPVCAPGR